MAGPTKSNATVLSVAPVTPKNAAPLRTPPDIASPVIGQSIMLELDGSRSPTLATMRGRAVNGRNSILIPKQQSSGDAIKEMKETSKQAVREKKSNAPDAAKQKRALKTKDIADENSQTFELRLKGKTATTNSRKSILEPFQMLSLGDDDDSSDEETEVLNPAMHWKNLFQVERQ